MATCCDTNSLNVFLVSQRDETQISCTTTKVFGYGNKVSIVRSIMLEEVWQIDISYVHFFSDSSEHVSDILIKFVPSTVSIDNHKVVVSSFFFQMVSNKWAKASSTCPKLYENTSFLFIIRFEEFLISHPINNFCLLISVFGFRIQFFIRGSETSNAFIDIEYLR